MGIFAKPGRLLIVASVLVSASCTTPQPSPSPKPESPPPPRVPPQRPTRPTPAPQVTPTPAPTAPLVLTAGPWTQSSAEDATVAVVVTIRSNGFFRDRAAIHYLQPATATIVRVVHLQNNAPRTLAQKEIKQACNSTLALTNDDVCWTGSRYVIRSSIKQTPIDPTHAVTLNVEAHVERPDEQQKRFEQSRTLNGVNQLLFGDGNINVSVEIAPPSEAAARQTIPAWPGKAAINSLYTQLQHWDATIKPLPNASAFISNIPAKFAPGIAGKGGEHLCLNADRSYTYVAQPESTTEVIEEEGTWDLRDGLLNLEPLKAETPSQRALVDKHYLLFTLRDTATGEDHLMLLGSNRSFELLAAQLREPLFLEEQRSVAIKQASLSRVSSENDPTPISKESLRNATEVFRAWSRLTQQYQLTYQNGSRRDGTFILTGDAAIQFADARFAAESIEISADYSVIKLRGPVHIDWDGKTYNSVDGVIHVKKNLVQYEAANLVARP